MGGGGGCVLDEDLHCYFYKTKHDVLCRYAVRRVGRGVESTEPKVFDEMSGKIIPEEDARTHTGGGYQSARTEHVITGETLRVFSQGGIISEMFKRNNNFVLIKI